MLRRSSLLATAALLVAAGCSHSAASAPAPAPSPARSTRPAAAAVPAGPTAANASAYADEVVTRTNNERRGARLAPYTRSINLMRAAQLQAEQMAKTGKLDHDIPGATYPTLGTRLAAVQYAMRAAGENIGEGYRTPAGAVSAWMGSAGHRANILSASYTEMGAAVALGPNGAVYWVQVFGRPK